MFRQRSCCGSRKVSVLAPRLGRTGSGTARIDNVKEIDCVERGKSPDEKKQKILFFLRETYVPVALFHHYRGFFFRKLRRHEHVAN